MLQQYLEKLGLDEKECPLYLVLAEIGVQPASVIARRCNLDRVTAYKHLKKLAERGFVKVYFRNGIQCFGIESFDALLSYVKDRAGEFGELQKLYPTAANLLQSLRGGEDEIPKLQMFEGESGMKGLFRDILFTVKEQGIRQIRMLTSNTFAEHMADEALAAIARSFFHDVQERKIAVELFEITGGLVPERSRTLRLRDIDPDNPPVMHGTTSIFVVGHSVYLSSYKTTKVALKITQAEVSQVFHFLFDVLGKDK